MSECEPKGVLGPGGLVKDERLLREISQTKPLQPTALRKLAGFYTAYQTNHVLGEHLALIALSQIVTNPKMQHAMQSVITHPQGAEIALTAPDIDQSAWDDFWDDFTEITPENTPSDAVEPKMALAISEVRWIPLHSFDLGMLIETPPSKKGTRPRHYAIGISPRSDTLPD